MAISNQQILNQLMVVTDKVTSLDQQIKSLDLQVKSLDQQVNELKTQLSSFGVNVNSLGNQGRTAVEELSAKIDASIANP